MVLWRRFSWQSTRVYTIGMNFFESFGFGNHAASYESQFSQLQELYTRRESIRAYIGTGGEWSGPDRQQLDALNAQIDELENELRSSEDRTVIDRITMLREKQAQVDWEKGPRPVFQQPESDDAGNIIEMPQPGSDEYEDDRRRA